MEGSNPLAMKPDKILSHMDKQPPSVYILAETAYLFPLLAGQVSYFFPNQFEFWRSPWLEKILNLAPLKYLEILPNCLDM